MPSTTAPTETCSMKVVRGCDGPVRIRTCRERETRSEKKVGISFLMIIRWWKILLVLSTKFIFLTSSDSHATSGQSNTNELCRRSDIVYNFSH